jgi:hypothetical protein
MKKQITITVPTDWSAVSLKKYIQLQKDIETYKDNEDAVTAVLFHHLCEVGADVVQRLDIQTFQNISLDLGRFMNKTDYPLQKIIKIGDIEYGFEPNLSEMAYGAYVDLSKYETLKLDEKWAEAMSILYRPIVKSSGNLYEIRGYEGMILEDLFLDVTMDVHMGAMGFFFSILRDVQKGILNSLKEMEGLPPSILTILEKSGNLTHQFTNWPEGMS